MVIFTPSVTLFKHITMKKLVFLSLLIVFAATAAKSQIKTKPEKTRLQAPSKIIAPVPVEPKTPPPPPSTNKSSNAGNQDIPVYTLTSARVNIKTGNDNKEFPSQVLVTLMAKSTPQDWRNYIQINLGNEMKINSDTEFGLDLEGRAPTPLETFQKSGIALSINYIPNFFADAWKIESVSLILEFKDQNGNLHPSLGRKTVVFSNAYGFLNNEFRYIKCFTDASFSPLTAVISKGY
jgi:hypothetical protein